MRGGEAFWSVLFARPGPVEIEIGSSDGSFLIARARRFPDRNFFGLERSPAKARRLEKRLARLEAPNVRVLQADAACVVASLLPDASVDAYHVYFPDPWPKRGHAGRRIFRPALVDGLARTLRPGGRLFVATDVADYASVTHDLVVAHSGFCERIAEAEHPGFTTPFARKYRAAGRPLYAFTFERGGERADHAVAASKMRSM